MYCRSEPTIKFVCRPTQEGWSVDVPPAEEPCFVLSAQSLYLRANFDPNPAGFKACYVDMKDGRILASGERIDCAFLIPRGISGYATEWALLTKESEPRVILSYPARTT